MPKYRKKPVVVEAVQLTPDMVPPDWLVAAQQAGVFCQRRDADGDTYWCIKTLEGEIKISPNAWIIKGIRGELYPCKPDVFERTYEDYELGKDAEAANIRVMGDKKDWQTLINTIKGARIKALIAPNSRERSIVITKLEEALMWAEHGRDAAIVVLDGGPNE